MSVAIGCGFHTSKMAAKYAHMHESRLVEETEAHVIILLGFRLSLLLFLGFFGSSRSCTTGWHGSKLLTSLSHQSFKVFAVELFDDLVEGSIFSVDSDGGQDLLDILGRWAGVSTEHGKQVCGHVTHCLSLQETRNEVHAIPC